jgi:hypothetical protein
LGWLNFSHQAEWTKWFQPHLSYATMVVSCDTIQHTIMLGHHFHHSMNSFCLYIDNGYKINITKYTQIYEIYKIDLCLGMKKEGAYMANQLLELEL